MRKHNHHIFAFFASKTQKAFAAIFSYLLKAIAIGFEYQYTPLFTRVLLGMCIVMQKPVLETRLKSVQSDKNWN